MRHPEGLVLDIVVGIVGAIIAGFLINPLIGGGNIMNGSFNAMSLVASFLGANEPHEVVFVRNATEAINLVAYTWARANVRPGDAIVVVGIDWLGRNAAEVMTTIRELGARGIVLRSLREGIDSSNATGRMIAGVLASLAELELELGRERRAAAREARRARGQHIGRPKVLDEKKTALAQRMHASGESASTIATALGVSRATVYRVLSVNAD